MNQDFPIAHELFGEIWNGMGGDPAWQGRVTFSGEGALRSPFAVTDFAAAVIATASAALGELLATTHLAPTHIHVDRILASGWFHLGNPKMVNESAAAPQKHSPWMIEFETADGRWLRAQAAFASLRGRLAHGLGVKEDPADIAAAVRAGNADELEARLVKARAAIAVNRTIEEWLSHPAGAAVHAEPIVDVGLGDTVVQNDWTPTAGRPLAGIRVLDLTRVIAGPTATKFLAACGAEVLRLDAPGSDESSGQVGVGNEQMVGKRWAFLDLHTPEGKERFLELLSRADILVHGYRPGGIDALVSAHERFQAKPDLVEVALRAYGWTGPWRDRRGFDSLVQWSSGIANETQAWALEDPAHRVPLVAIGRVVDASRPRHMPVEALDLGTAYQIAAAAIRGLTRRIQTGRGSVSKLSIARTASILIAKGRVPDQPQINLPLDGPWDDRVFMSAKGPIRRLAFPVQIDGNPLFWERASELPGSSNPVWATTAD